MVGKIFERKILCRVSDKLRAHLVPQRFLIFGPGTKCFRGKFLLYLIIKTIKICLCNTVKFP